MRVIGFFPVFTFAVLTCIQVLLSVYSAQKLSLNFAGGVLLFYFYLMVFLRIGLRLFTIPEGPIKQFSREECCHQYYQLVYMFFLLPIMRAGIIPTPMTRLFYKALGAKVGPASYFGGLVFDPQFIEIGSNSLMGERSLLVPHLIEGDSLSFHKIRIGNRVTVGANSVILPGVTIDDDAIVAALSVVPKHTHIGEGEVWGGNPARLIKKRGTAP